MSRILEWKGIKPLDSSSIKLRFVESRSNYTLGAHISASPHSPPGRQERVPLKRFDLGEQRFIEGVSPNACQYLNRRTLLVLRGGGPTVWSQRSPCVPSILVPPRGHGVRFVRLGWVRLWSPGMFLRASALLASLTA